MTSAAHSLACLVCLVCLVCVAFALGCASEPRVSLGADRSAVHDAALATYDASHATDDDDAAPPKRTDEGDDIANSAECMELEVVCGSDGKDYRNRCDAEDAGVHVAKQGTCHP